MYYQPILEGEASRERHQQMIKEAEYFRQVRKIQGQVQNPARRIMRLVTALVSIK